MNKLFNEKIESIKWEEFNIDDIFDVFTGAMINKNDIKEGSVPRITATAENNGIAMFTRPINQKNFRMFQNFISISFLGNAFYHKYRASLDMKIHGIKPKDHKLNKHIALFLIPLIEKFSSKYMYGNQLSTKVLKRQKLLLPINTKGYPDWLFMEKFMREIEEITTPNITFIQNTILDHRDLEDVEWREFNLDKIFDIKSGVRLTKSEMKSGEMPFIGATDSKNGITNFVSNINDSMDSNVLGVNYNGSVVENFYHPYTAIFSDDVKRLTLKRKKRNKYLYLFLKTVILQQKEKYMYAYKFNTSRMKRQKIMLPVNSDGDPDWDFMEQYMKRLENDLFLKVK